jgi:phenylpropionate dioxygenase-like ring-hydroxylating dioxygenase large terminal subunit
MTTATAQWLLPAAAYTSRSWYAVEQDRLFGKVWNMVGTLDDLDGPPAGLVAEVAGASVRVERSSDGSLRASQQDRPVATGVWAGYVFVHLDPDHAPTLEAWLGEFPRRIGGFQPDHLVEVARHRFELKANWKLFVENHIDVYHLWYLHADSLGAYDHPRARWEMCGPHWVFYEPPRSDVDIHDESFWRGLTPLRHVGEDQWGSGAHLVFPNLTLATGAGFFMTYQCTPLAPDRSLVDLRVRAEPEADPVEMVEMSRRVIEREDGSACEAMQLAAASPWFEVGPLARTHELPITHFHELVLEAMA